MTGIYKITSPTGKVYIGQSVDIVDRFTHYRNSHKAIQKQKKLHSSLLKYGWSSHEATIVHNLPNDVTREVLNAYEILYMEAYRDCGIELLNIREGGLSGRHSEETKLKISESEKGKKISEETREKLRLCSPKIRLYSRGKTRSEEAKSKMRKPHKINPNRVYGTISAEHKIKMQEARKKVPHPFLGKSHTQESKDKISKSKFGCKGTQNKKIICSVTGAIYGSIKDAAIAIGMQPNTLRMQLRGSNTNSTSFSLFNH